MDELPSGPVHRVKCELEIYTYLMDQSDQEQPSKELDISKSPESFWPNEICEASSDTCVFR